MGAEAFFFAVDDAWATEQLKGQPLNINTLLNLGSLLEEGNDAGSCIASWAEPYLQEIETSLSGNN